MSERRAHALERRRDRRIPVAARVRFEPRESGVALGGGPGRSSEVVQAELVDVSAGGLRARCPLPLGLTPGRSVDVEITVQGSGPGGPAPLVNLRGRGEVVRIEQRSSGCYTALKFIGALSLREPFAQMLLF